MTNQRLIELIHLCMTTTSEDEFNAAFNELIPHIQLSTALTLADHFERRYRIARAILN